MSDGNTGVPLLVATPLAERVPISEYEACPEGLVRRTVHPTVPPSVEYTLTSSGQALLGPLSQVANWAVAHYADATTVPPQQVDSRAAGT